MFEQSPRTLSFHRAQSIGPGEPVQTHSGTQEEAREGRGGNFPGMHRTGGGPAQKTAGKNETRESERLRGKPRAQDPEETRALVNREETGG